jgi:hypothetical protein
MNVISRPSTCKADEARLGCMRRWCLRHDDGVAAEEVSVKRCCDRSEESQTQQSSDSYVIDTD